jgi:hypothetical protein
VKQPGWKTLVPAPGAPAAIARWRDVRADVNAGHRIGRLTPVGYGRGIDPSRDLRLELCEDCLIHPRGRRPRGRAKTQRYAERDEIRRSRRGVFECRAPDEQPWAEGLDESRSGG